MRVDGTTKGATHSSSRPSRVPHSTSDLNSAPHPAFLFCILHWAEIPHPAFLFRIPHRVEIPHSLSLSPLTPAVHGFPPAFHSGFGPSVSKRTARAPALITPAMCTKSTFVMSSDGW